MAADIALQGLMPVGESREASELLLQETAEAIDAKLQ
jgi:hypothetical protein